MEMKFGIMNKKAIFIIGIIIVFFIAAFIGRAIGKRNEENRVADEFKFSEEKRKKS